MFNDSRKGLILKVKIQKLNINTLITVVNEHSSYQFSDNYLGLLSSPSEYSNFDWIRSGQVA